MSRPPETRPTPPSPANSNQHLQEGYGRLKLGDFPGAADIAQALLRANARYVEAWVLLCSALIRMGSPDDDRALADALAAIPVTDPAHSMLAVERVRVLANRGRCNEAFELARIITTHVRLAPRQHDVLSNAFTTCGLFEEALAHSEIASTGLPNDVPAAYNRALALRNLGRISEAIEDFEKLLRRAPGHSLAHFSLADARRWTAGENHIDAIQTAIRRENHGELDLPRLNYALFKEAHDCGDHALAWQALSDGARLVNERSPYDFAERTEFTEGLISRFSGGLDAAPTESDGPVPIFIVGLPRSGTTLVERIFSAHPDVTDMGETHGFALAIRDALGLARFGELDLSSVTRMSGIEWRRVADLYLESLAYRGLSTRFFTEKLPHNYHLVGAMRRAFPEARIVHLRRAPMDSLFGAYKVLFGVGAYLWSYTFEDLARAYGLYRRLTDHWRREFGGHIAEVTLENLIASPDAEIRSLLERTGLSFHEACLAPHATSGGVSTASSTQVRQPINSQGVGAWRKYAEGFEPLRQRLENAGFVDSAGNPVW